jgi:lysophospholipase L1-like esterase
MLKSFARWPAAAGAVALLAVLGVATATPGASATATGSAAHTRSGKVINTLVVGDSYVAGNGSSGPTYNVSPDDVGTPPAPYSGTGCYRKYQNASMIAYNSLGSAGYYINRACSSKKTGDVLHEVADLNNNDFAPFADLIVYSAGGNDVDFHDIAVHCIIKPGLDFSEISIGGKGISRNCYNLLAAMKKDISGVVKAERANLTSLLTDFSNADIVMDGYPMLVNKVKSAGAGDVQANTINYAYAQLSVMMPSIEKQQAVMVQSLAQTHSGRIAYNDVFTGFGGVAGNHGVYSAKPWLYGLRPDTDIDESMHPNPTGQQQIAAGIVAAVRKAGWFTGYPVQPGAAVQTFNYIPGSTGTGDAQLGSGLGIVYTTLTGVPRLTTCRQQTLTFTKKWVSSGRAALDLVNAGPDTVKVNCSYPATGDIMVQGSGLYLVTNGGSTASFKVESIPGATTFECLDARPTAKFYAISKALLTFHKVAGTGTCTQS